MRRLSADLHRQAVDKSLFARLENILEHELAHEMAFKVEQGKIDVNKGLSNAASINLGFIEPNFEVNITTIDLTRSLANHAHKIQDCAKETLMMAGIAETSVDTVIFVGGSSLMSVVESALADIFPNATLQHADAFTAIVDGLAVGTSRMNI